MQHDAPQHDSAARWWTLSVLIWTLLIVGITFRGLATPTRNNCFFLYYARAGQSWYHGVELYLDVQLTCRYSPLIHAFLVPFSLLPVAMGTALWRLVNTLVFLLGLWAWVRAVLPGCGLRPGQGALLFLLVIPMALGSVNNAQANPLTMGLALAGVAAVARQRWQLAAFCLVGACLIKLYFLALALLLIASFPRRFAWPFALALVVGLAAPFLLQDPAYVARQYGNWIYNLRADDRSEWDLAFGYRDLWQLLRLAHLTVAKSVYGLMQLGLAGMVGLLCLAYRPRELAQRVNTLLGLGCWWMTLCGPATESSTYLILAPTMAWSLLEWFNQDHGHNTISAWVTRILIVTASVLFLAAWLAGATPYTRNVHALGLQPLGALLLGTVLIGRVVHALVTPQEPQADSNARQAQAA